MERAGNGMLNMVKAGDEGEVEEVQVPEQGPEPVLRMNAKGDEMRLQALERRRAWQCWWYGRQ
jgi:hypothetical protein